MKKLTILLSLFFSLALVSQNKQLLKGDSMVWYGLDYSKAKFTGNFAAEAGFDLTSGKELVEKYMPGWNSVVLYEPMKYDIGTKMGKVIVYNDIASVTKINASIKASDSIYYDKSTPYKFSNPDQTIQEMLNKYEGEKYKNGLGVVFIVESYNKKTNDAYIYYTLFDVENRKLIGYKRLKGFPKGIGMKNYWSGATDDIMKQCGSAYKSIEYQALKGDKK